MASEILCYEHCFFLSFTEKLDDFRTSEERRTISLVPSVILVYFAQDYARSNFQRIVKTENRLRNNSALQ